jgi:hypothetical protein
MAKLLQGLLIERHGSEGGVVGLHSPGRQSHAVEAQMMGGTKKEDSLDLPAAKLPEGLARHRPAEAKTGVGSDKGQEGRGHIAFPCPQRQGIFLQNLLQGQAQFLWLIRIPGTGVLCGAKFHKDSSCLQGTTSRKRQEGSQRQGQEASRQEWDSIYQKIPFRESIIQVFSF